MSDKVLPCKHCGLPLTQPADSDWRTTEHLTKKQCIASLAKRLEEAERDWANHACEHLPEGWSIEVELEKNSGVMLLRDPDGCHVEICTDDITLEQQIFDAVDAAIAAEKQNGPT